MARRRIARLRDLDRRIGELGRQLGARVAGEGTALTGLMAVGPILAARILGEVGDVRRYPNEAHFASANGTAPIPASSGRADRHRLNRDGNRRLNRASHYVALTQATWEPRAVAYLARKTRRGQDPPRGAAVPEASTVERHLPHSRHRSGPDALDGLT